MSHYLKHNCEDAIQNFLNLFATHLRDFKGYKNHSD